ncbi:hypothetical protein D3C85_1625240 [compost metagenome]
MAVAVMQQLVKLHSGLEYEGCGLIDIKRGRPEIVTETWGRPIIKVLAQGLTHGLASASVMR